MADVYNRQNFQDLINKFYTKITYEYAYELESLGLWKWAIFVVLHLENSNQKSKYVKDTLLKNAHSEHDLDFLVEE
jgi:nuclear pore complex protein Nup98-Nup96